MDDVVGDPSRTRSCGGRWSRVRWRLPVIALVVIVASAACGDDDSDGSGPFAAGGDHRAQLLDNLGVNDSDMAEVERTCLQALVAEFDDDQLDVLFAQKPDAQEMVNRVTSESARCHRLAIAPTGDEIADPVLEALVADPVGWMQSRWDVITDAICDDAPDRLTEVVSSHFGGLEQLRDRAGQDCPKVKVTRVDSTSGGTELLDYWNPGEAGKQIRLQVSNSGWSGEDKIWFALFVREDGVWKLNSEPA